MATSTETAYCNCCQKFFFSYHIEVIIKFYNCANSIRPCFYQDLCLLYISYYHVIELFSLETKTCKSTVAWGSNSRMGSESSGACTNGIMGVIEFALQRSSRSTLKFSSILLKDDLNRLTCKQAHMAYTAYNSIRITHSSFFSSFSL